MRNKIQYLFLTAGLIFVCGAPLARALSIDDISGSGGSGLTMDNSGLINGGNPSNQYISGTLLNDGGTIYLIRGSQKIPFTSAQAFIGLGYSFAYVVSGDSSNYSSVSGYVISTAQAVHPWGSWLSYKGTVYYSTSQGMVGVPSLDVLTANGGSMAMVLPANKYDVAQLNANPNLPVLSYNDQRVYSSASLTFSGGQTYNFSGNTNTTTPAATGGPLAITAPLAATQLTPASLYTISWTGGPVGGSVNINLIYQVSCYAGTSATSTCGSVQNIAAAAPNTGSYSWLVPGAISVVPNGYQIQISDASNPSSSVLSSGFSIGVPAPVTVSTVVATSSLPTLALLSSNVTLTYGNEVLGKITITAPTSTDVTLQSIPLSVSSTGGVFISSAVNNVVIIDESTLQSISSQNTALGLTQEAAAPPQSH